MSRIKPRSRASNLTNSARTPPGKSRGPPNSLVTQRFQYLKRLVLILWILPGLIVRNFPFSSRLITVNYDWEIRTTFVIPSVRVWRPKAMPSKRLSFLLFIVFFGKICRGRSPISPNIFSNFCTFLANQWSVSVQPQRETAVFAWMPKKGKDKVKADVLARLESLVR